MLLLFDIDGTLLLKASAEHKQALHDAICAVHHIDIPAGRIEAAGRTAPAIARSTVISSLADTILVSGPMAGSGPDVETVAAVREAVPEDVPVLLNTGAKKETIAAFLEHADGAVVGSALKVDGYTWNSVDPTRVQEFVAAARG